VSGGVQVTVRMPWACHLPSLPKVSWILEESGDVISWSEAVCSGLARVSPPDIRGDGSIAEATATLPDAPRRLLRVKFTYTP
jgi:hypothetical protein